MAFVWFLRPGREGQRHDKKTDTHLPVLIVAAVLMACAAAVLAVSEKAEAAFPGKNGKIAFTSLRDGRTGSEDIYTMNPRGTAVHRLTNNPVGDFNPDWQPLWPPDNTTRAVKVISTSPKANATRVAPAANIRATFSKDMKPKIINNTTFKLFKKKGSTTKKIAAAVGYSAATDKATLNPRKRLQKGATYKAVVTKGAKDVAGKSLEQNTTKAGLQQKVWSFKVKR